MSLQALNSALTGLRVAQQQLNVLSNNIANVGTPGYTRKILPQSTQTLSTGQGIGVLSDTIIRKVDMNLSRDLWTQVSAVSSSDVQSRYLSSIEAFNGPPDKELSLSSYISELKDTFVQLADAPNDSFLLQASVNQAIDVAHKFNDYGTLITQLRIDAQNEMVSSISAINAALNEIANFNVQIKNATSVGRTSADLQDRRDEAIKKLSQELEVTYFNRSDGVVVVQTSTGVELAAEQASPLFFQPGAVTPTTTYPSTMAGVYTGGFPSAATAFDLTDTDLGGRLGGLIDLRDSTLMEYQAQLDELAHKLTTRLDAQGLRLFTNPQGEVPADTAPNPNTDPPVPVTYVGFATNIRVNSAIINNVNLLQTGTYTSDKTIATGSNEVVQRVLDYAFGTVNYQQASGSIDLRVAGPATDLQQWLGIHSENRIVNTVDLSAYPEIDDSDALTTTDLSGALADLFPNWPNDDQVVITFSDPRTGEADTSITLDLSVASAQAGVGINDALDQIIAEINAQITAESVPAEFAAVASRNANNQLVITTRANMTINASAAGGMGAEALEALGLEEGTFTTADPYFEVQIADDNPVRIYIEPGDTEDDLLDKLRWNPLAETGVPGLSAEIDASTGRLTLRPGMDASNGGPNFGGSIRFVGGPFTTDSPVNAVLNALPQDVSLTAALFGNYNVSGGVVTEHALIEDVPYQSETTAGSGIYVGYRTQYLGQAADKGTGILVASNIIDYGQKLINKQTQDLVVMQGRQDDDTTLRDLLQRRLTDETGVNIDEEMSNLIVIQTAYAAAARAVTAADEMFQELLNSLA